MGNFPVVLLAIPKGNVNKEYREIAASYWCHVHSHSNLLKFSWLWTV